MVGPRKLKSAPKKRSFITWLTRDKLPPFALNGLGLIEDSRPLKRLRRHSRQGASSRLDRRRSQWS